MHVTGISFIRNAIQYDYPIVEAITSILSVCDYFIVAVGKSEDKTRALIESIGSDKIEILDTIWNDALRTGGRVLAEETNKALAAVPAETDWVFYIQGDEVLHERYLPNVQSAMEQWKDDARTDGLLFDYRHFYGSYDYVGDATSWYRREVRVVRPHRGVYSYRDAQGFRKGDDEKLRVRHCGATMYHYGWVKDALTMQAKATSFNRYWHDDAWMVENVLKREEFDFSIVGSLQPFGGTHPAVMQERIARQNWTFDYDLSRNQYSLKERFKRWIERRTGWLPGEYRNYRLLR